MLLNLILLIFILGILVFIHELGHFLFAKKSGVYIYEFSIGMGPKIKGFVGKDGINYSIRALPIGGYVQMAGEVYEDDNQIPTEKFMCNRPWYQRVLILIAGVSFNFILALVLLFFIALIWGTTNNKPIVGTVLEDSPVEKAGIVPGDVITHINGKRVQSWDETQLRLIINSKNDYYTFTVKHSDGTTEKYDIKPEITKDEDGNETKTFGVGVDTTIHTGFVNAIKYAFTKFAIVIDTMCITIANLFTGNLSLNALSGPVGIYSIVDQTVSLGIANVIYLIAFLSINLGFVNILPFPAFDGGRVLFLIIEKIKGSKVDSELENKIHTVGFILLMILMLYITAQDIIRLF